MTKTITVDVGELYESLHIQFSDKIGEEYDEQIRKEVEDFLHRYNQQLDRQVEQSQNIEEVDEGT